MKPDVLIVIDKFSKLIHVGDPETFDDDLLVKYCKSGCTITTVPFDKYKEFALYEEVEVIIKP